MGEVANTEYSRLLRNVSYFTLSLIVPDPTATSAAASRVPAASSASPSGVMRGRSQTNSPTLPYPASDLGGDYPSFHQFADDPGEIAAWFHGSCFVGELLAAGVWSRASSTRRRLMLAQAP